MQKLTLRRLCAADAADFADMINSPGVYEMTVGYPKGTDVTSAEKMIIARLNMETRGTGMERAIIADGVFVGTVGVGVTNRRCATGSLSYVVVPTVSGRGIATQAARLMLPQAADALKINIFTAASFKDNAPSLRVLEKLGFERMSEDEYTVMKDGKERKVLKFILPCDKL